MLFCEAQIYDIKCTFVRSIKSFASFQNPSRLKFILSLSKDLSFYFFEKNKKDAVPVGARRKVCFSFEGLKFPKIEVSRPL